MDSAPNFPMPDAPALLSAVRRRQSSTATDDNEHAISDGPEQPYTEHNGVTYTYKPIHRVVQACGNCRRKKSRCNGQRPKCKTCRRLSQECVYPSTEPRRRSDKEATNNPPGSISSDSTLQTLSEANNVTQDVLIGKLNQLEARMSEMHNTIMSIGHFIQRSASENGTDTAPSNHRLSTVSLETASNSHFNAHGLSNGNGDGTSTPYGWSGANGTGNGSSSKDPIRSNPQDPTLFRGLLPFTVILDTVNVYFNYSHNQPYSFFHEGNFRQRLADGSLPDHLIFAVLANAARFSSNPFFGGKPVSFAETYANRSWASIVSQVFAGGEQPNFCTVQSITMLAIFDFTAGRGRHGSAWVKIGLSVRIAQDLRLMMEHPTSHSPSSHIEERRRTFWSIYILDRLVSCGRARPPAILEACCQLQLPCDEDVWRSGQFEKTQTMEGFSNRRLSDANDYSPFALVVLTTYVLSRSAQYNLQEYNIRSKEPPWDPNSDFASILSDLMYLENHFDFGRPAADVIRQGLGSDGQIDQSRAGPTIFAHAIFYLANCLLNHPFLIRRRLELSEVKGSTTFFLSRTFESSRDYATRLTHLLSETTKAGFVVMTSFYGYCAVVAGSIHGLYSHTADETTALEAFQLLQQCNTFLEGLSRYWRNCSTMRNVLRSFSTDNARFQMLIQPIQHITPLDPTDVETMWSMMDYSTMSNMANTPVTEAAINDSPSFVPDGNGQWLDLFNSMGAFGNCNFADANSVPYSSNPAVEATPHSFNSS